MSSYRHVLEYYKVQELRLHIKTEILSDIFDYQIVYILMTTLNKILEKKTLKGLERTVLWVHRGPPSISCTQQPRLKTL